MFGCCNLRGVACLSDLVRMEVLRIHNCCRVEDVSFLRGMRKLRSLELSGGSMDSIEALSGCLELVDLDLSYCVRLRSLDGLFCEKLERIVLYGCRSLASVDRLRGGGNLKLKYVNLVGCGVSF